MLKLLTMSLLLHVISQCIVFARVLPVNNRNADITHINNNVGPYEVETGSDVGSRYKYDTHITTNDTATTTTSPKSAIVSNLKHSTNNVYVRGKRSTPKLYSDPKGGNYALPILSINVTIDFTNQFGKCSPGEKSERQFLEEVRQSICPKTGPCSFKLSSSCSNRKYYSMLRKVYHIVAVKVIPPTFVLPKCDAACRVTAMRMQLFKAKPFVEARLKKSNVYYTSVFARNVNKECPSGYKMDTTGYKCFDKHAVAAKKKISSGDVSKPKVDKHAVTAKKKISSGAVSKPKVVQNPVTAKKKISSGDVSKPKVVHHQVIAKKKIPIRCDNLNTKDYVLPKVSGNVYISFMNQFGKCSPGDKLEGRYIKKVRQAICPKTGPCIFKISSRCYNIKKNMRKVFEIKANASLPANYVVPQCNAKCQVKAMTDAMDKTKESVKGRLQKAGVKYNMIYPSIKTVYTCPTCYKMDATGFKCFASHKAAAKKKISSGGVFKAKDAQHQGTDKKKISSGSVSKPKVTWPSKKASFIKKVQHSPYKVTWPSKKASFIKKVQHSPYKGPPKKASFIKKAHHSPYKEPAKKSPASHSSAKGKAKKTSSKAGHSQSKGTSKKKETAKHPHSKAGALPLRTTIKSMRIEHYVAIGAVPVFILLVIIILRCAKRGGQDPVPENYSDNESDSSYEARKRSKRRKKKRKARKKRNKNNSQRVSATSSETLGVLRASNSPDTLRVLRESNTFIGNTTRNNAQTSTSTYLKRDPEGEAGKFLHGLSCSKTAEEQYIQPSKLPQICSSTEVASIDSCSPEAFCRLLNISDDEKANDKNYNSGKRSCKPSASIRSARSGDIPSSTHDNESIEYTSLLQEFPKSTRIPSYPGLVNYCTSLPKALTITRRSDGALKNLYPV